MTGLVGRHLRRKDSSAQHQVANHVHHLVPSALIREAEGEIVEIALAHRKLGNIEKGGELLSWSSETGCSTITIRVVHVPSPDQIVLEQELYFMEKDKGPARAEFQGIFSALIPMRRLHSQDLRTEIHGDVE